MLTYIETKHNNNIVDLFTYLGFRKFEILIGPTFHEVSNSQIINFNER